MDESNLDQSHLDESNLDHSNLSSSPSRNSPSHAQGSGRSPSSRNSSTSSRAGLGLGQRTQGQGLGQGLGQGEELTNFEKLRVAQASLRVDPRYFQGQGLGPEPASTFASPFSYDELQQQQSHSQLQPRQSPLLHITTSGDDIDDDDDDNHNNNGDTASGSTKVDQNPLLHISYSVQKSKQSTPAQSRSGSKIPSRRPSAELSPGKGFHSSPGGYYMAHTLPLSFSPSLSPFLFPFNSSFSFLLITTLQPIIQPPTFVLCCNHILLVFLS